MSHEENPYGGYGGHAISFLEGSKVKIVGSCCGDTDGGGGTDPGTGGPEPVFCEISAVNPDHKRVCRAACGRYVVVVVVFVVVVGALPGGGM